MLNPSWCLTRWKNPPWILDSTLSFVAQFLGLQGTLEQQADMENISKKWEEMHYLQESGYEVSIREYPKNRM